MKKTILIFLISLVMAGLGVTFVSAAELNNWEANIKISSGNASNRLSFGVKPEATDSRDGLYDAPAMLAGSLQAYFLDQKGSLWRDIRAPKTTQEWLLVITNKTEMPISISWNNAYFPDNAVIELFDTVDNKIIDMYKSNHYTFDSNADFEITIKFTP